MPVLYGCQPQRVTRGLYYFDDLDKESPTDFTALGDNVNITARLASQAGTGEILISNAAYVASHLDLGDLEHRKLELKSKSEKTEVRVLQISSN